MNNNVSILKRLFKDYTSKFIKKIFYAILLTIVLAVSTSSIAYLLDPAIKKIFIDKDQTLIYLIPLAIVIAFAAKGISLYGARHIMIGVAEEVKANVQKDMIKSFVVADTQFIEKKHTGKMVSNLTADVGMLTNLISTVILNLFKDSLTLLGLLFVMFYQNWKLALISIIMIPLAGIASKTLGKRIKNVFSLKGKIIQIKYIKKNQYVGYNRTYKTKTKIKVAIVGLGYEDGIPRSLSNKGYVYFKKNRFKIIGRISMDTFTVDISKSSHDLNIGMYLDIINDEHKIDKFAKLCKTIPNEIMTSIGKRVCRKYE